MNNKGTWIFISHSHKDIKAVRQIRNIFEEKGCEPIVFYLKCLNDESEIEDLIKREIDEREWFVYVDSENARASKWVNTERKYIENQPNKNIITIDLNNDYVDEVKKIARGFNVLISYAQTNEYIAKQIYDILRYKEYGVFINDTFSSIGDFNAAYDKALSQCECFLLLIDEQLLQVADYEEKIMKTLKIAMDYEKTIVPVLIGDIKVDTLPKKLNNMLGCFIKLRINQKPTEDDLNIIVKFVEQHIPHKTT